VSLNNITFMRLEVRSMKRLHFSVKSANIKSHDLCAVLEFGTDYLVTLTFVRFSCLR